MRIIVLGQGGREHAIVRALRLDQSEAHELWAMPGSAGMSDMASIIDQSLDDHPQVLSKILGVAPDLVVIGPEVPLAEGLSDKIRARGIPVFGPDGRAAQLEASKILSKDFMLKYKIPTARSVVVETLDQLLVEAEQFTAPYVLKADGLAAGKGVFICANLEELKTSGDQIFNKKSLGEAGSRALLEEALFGEELSAFVLTNGSEYRLMPFAQDHKRLKDHELGPNTGGMGSVAPLQTSTDSIEELTRLVIEPTLKGFKEESFLYRGVLFIGLMLTESGIKVLEYNVRFGDPETQVLLPLLEGSWAQVLNQIALGEMPDLKWKKECATCIVLAAEGYPDQVVKGAELRGIDALENTTSYVLHAGTSKHGDQWFVNGGRVLNVVGLGLSLDESRKRAYDRAQGIVGHGLQMRTDIGVKAQKLGPIQ